MQAKDSTVLRASCGPVWVWGIFFIALWSVPASPETIPVGGTCGLDEAIDNANADSQVHADCLAGSGPDTLQLGGDVTLTAIDNTTDGANGLPSITSEIIIEGGGFTVERDGAAPNFRLFHIGAGGELLLDHVTVRGGRLDGGTAAGGGVFNRGVLTLFNGTIAGNAIDTNTYGYGAGLYNLGTAVIDSSTISGNQVDSANAFGGGVFSALGALLDVDLSVVSNNTVSSSRMIGLAAGGGIETWGIALLTQTTVSGNRGEVFGVYAQMHGGGVNFVRGSLSMSESTVSGNSGYGDALADNALLFGGGLSVDDGLLNVSASTISGNSLVSASGFSAALGGGVDHGDDTGTISYSTLSGNSVSASFQADGGALYVGTTGSARLNLIGVLLADNTGGNCAGAGSIMDIQNNLADDTSCGGVPATLTGLDPLLLDNGGPTMTHALLPGSSAIDAAGACGIPADQRGVLRDDGVCDVGAYELNDCLAQDGNQQTLTGPISTEVSYEVCNSITGASGLMVVGPGGRLNLRAGVRVIFEDGVSVGADGELSVEIDPSLAM